MVLYGVCPIYEEQRKLIDKYCFDKCGKILFGGLIDDMLGLLPCREKICPHEDARLKYGKVRNEVLYIRKLKGES